MGRKFTTHDVECPECGSKMVLKKNSRFSTHGLWYACPRYPNCKAAHGAHPDGRPLGIPANQATKDARIRAHDAFDAMWHKGGMSRNAAYKWLAEQLGMTRDECHIGRFDEAACERVIDACSGDK